MQNSHVSPTEAIRTTPSFPHFWKRNGSFLRFQELSLKYNLKTPWIKKTGLSSVDLEFVANNLFTIDKVKYFDPEQASANGAAYPIPATYTFQVYLKF